MSNLKEFARKQSTQTIFDCIVMLKDAQTEEQILSRAALCSVYEEREGGEAMDALMDLLW